MDKSSNKSPAQTKGKTNKSIVTNGINKYILNHSDEMIENRNILRIPLRSPSATNKNDEIINEKRLVKDMCMDTNL